MTEVPLRGSERPAEARSGPPEGWDETEGWIFSTAGHRWISRRRNTADRVGHSYQRPTTRYPPYQARPGWEYGLFGFKDVTQKARGYVFRAEDMAPGKVML